MTWRSEDHWVPHSRATIIVAPHRSWPKVREELITENRPEEVFLLTPDVPHEKVYGKSIDSWEVRHCSPEEWATIYKNGLDIALDSRVRGR